MTRHLPHALLAVALAFAGTAAHAFNLSFMANTPMTYLTAKDKASLTKAGVDVLSNKADGEEVTWHNDGLGNSVAIQSKLVASDTRKDGARTCRTLAVELQAKGQQQRWRPTYCRTGQGHWLLQKQ